MKYEPMLAETGDLSLLENDEYVFEPKLDGTRCVVVKRGRRIYMFNRLGQDISYLFPLIRKDFEQYEEDFMLDGEIICYNERGQPDHRLLMRRSIVINKNEIDMNAHAIPATYVAFDILVLNKDELITKELEERKAILKKLIRETTHVERMLFTDEGNKLWMLAKRSKMEGIMAKKKKSCYYPGKRSKDWLKIKNKKSVDAVITAYSLPRGRGKIFSSLTLGLYKGSKLVKIGSVKTGWDNESRKFIMKKMKPLVKKKKGNTYQLKPELVCEVDYLELTKEKELRSPVFKRLRHKQAKHCTWKQLKK